MPLSDLVPDTSSMNRVVDPAQQPPGGENVTPAHDPQPAANILNAGEAREQALRQAATELTKEKEEQAKHHEHDGDPAYKFEISNATHHVRILPEQGLSYSYKAICTCAWQGRFMTTELAEETAKKHLARSIPRR